jgi:hypothetical protein
MVNSIRRTAAFSLAGAWARVLLHHACPLLWSRCVSAIANCVASARASNRPITRTIRSSAWSTLMPNLSRILSAEGPGKNVGWRPRWAASD